MLTYTHIIILLLVVPGRVVRLMTEMRFNDNMTRNEQIQHPIEVELAMTPIILE